MKGIDENEDFISITSGCHVRKRKCSVLTAKSLKHFVVDISY